MTTVLPKTYQVQSALEHLQEQRVLQFKTIKGDTYYINRFYAWGKTHYGLRTVSVDGTPIEYLQEGIIILLLDNGVHIYQESRYGTSGEVTLTNDMATQSNIEQTIKMALEGIK